MRRWTIVAVVAILASGQGSGAAIDENRLQAQVQRLHAGAAGGDWKHIPWVASLAEARRCSQQEHAPVFLFTHDGNMESGRC